MQLKSLAVPLWGFLMVSACLLLSSISAPLVGAGDGNRLSPRTEADIVVLYAKTWARPAKLSHEQRRRILQLSDQISPPGGRVWFVLVSGPGCFAGDRVQVFYRPTQLDPGIRRGHLAFIGLVAELEEDSVDRPLSFYAQVPRHGKTFPDSLSIPRLRDIPFHVDSAVDDQLIIDAISILRTRDRSFRREHLGSLHLEGDTIKVMTGTTTGRIATLRRGPDGLLVVNLFGFYHGG
jgi:hypothetical protein